MPHLTTLLMMIVLSSLTLAALAAWLGREFWREGIWQLALSLALFGVSYSCMSLLTSPLRHVWLGIGYALFSCAICASMAALYRFHRIALPAWVLIVCPLCTTAVFILLLDLPDTRTRTVCAVLALQNLWIVHVMVRRRRNTLTRGEIVHLLGATLITMVILLRVVLPKTSLSALPAESSALPVLSSYIVFFVALHLKAVGFLMMAHTRCAQQLTRFAYEDSLTGLANRRSVMQFLQQAQQEAEHHSRNLAVLMVDIDHFKRINDQCGHPVGDQVLAGLGQILRTKTRPQSMAGRYGGEEFLVICPNTTADEALQLANRLCDEVRSSLSASHASEKWPVTVSVGISATPLHAQQLSAETLLQQADEALYQAKHAGRDQVCRYGSPKPIQADEAENADSVLETLSFPAHFVRKVLGIQAQK